VVALLGPVDTTAHGVFVGRRHVELAHPSAAGFGELIGNLVEEEEPQRASIGLASNLPFSGWGAVSRPPRLVAAIVDRITFNAHILETGTESYRLRTPRRRHGANTRADLSTGLPLPHQPSPLRPTR
jgi:IstB-like ATP binding protein